MTSNLTDCDLELKERSSISLNERFTIPEKNELTISARKFTFRDNKIWERYTEVDNHYKLLPSSGLEFDYEKLYPIGTKLKISQTAPADLRLVMEELVGKRAQSAKKDQTPIARNKPVSRSNILVQSSSAEEPEDQKTSHSHHRYSTVHASPLRKNS